MAHRNVNTGRDGVLTASCCIAGRSSGGPAALRPNLRVGGRRPGTVELHQLRLGLAGGWQLRTRRLSAPGQQDQLARRRRNSVGRGWGCLRTTRASRSIDPKSSSAAAPPPPTRQHRRPHRSLQPSLCRRRSGAGTHPAARHSAEQAEAAEVAEAAAVRRERERSRPLTTIDAMAGGTGACCSTSATAPGATSRWRHSATVRLQISHCSTAELLPPPLPPPPPPPPPV